MKLVVWKSKDGWRVRLVARNGRILMSSEAYSSKRKAMEMAKKIHDWAGFWPGTAIPVVVKP